MQPYTHFLVGVLLSRAFPGEPIAQGACILGSVLPDLTMGPVLVLDRVKGNKTSSLTNKASWLQTTVEILHSIPVLLTLAAAAFKFDSYWMWALYVGIDSHISIDMCTHSGKEYEKDDVTHLWPIPTKIKLGHVLGFWEYRNAPGDLCPKTEEIGFMIFLTFLIIGTLI